MTIRFVRSIIGLSIVVVTFGTVGCGVGIVRDSSRSASVNMDYVDSTVADAKEFGKLVIPEGVWVLNAEYDHGLDTIYRLAIVTDPDGLRRLLAESGFTTPFEKMKIKSKAGETTGPRLSTSQSVLWAQDRFRNADEETIGRTFLIDERSASLRMVHVTIGG